MSIEELLQKLQKLVQRRLTAQELEALCQAEDELSTLREQAALVGPLVSGLEWAIKWILNHTSHDILALPLVAVMILKANKLIANARAVLGETTEVGDGKGPKLYTSESGEKWHIRAFPESAFEKKDKEPPHDS